MLDSITLARIDDGIWFDPFVQPVAYEREYFDKYLAYASTELGVALTRARVDLVKRHSSLLPLLDIGVGCGQFVEAWGGWACGYDVNPVAIAWLKQADRWADAYSNLYPVMTFWDSLEHIEHPAMILRNVTHFVFVSVPIFRDEAHILGSKHYRPDEHWWYFTHDGFVRFMDARGFCLLESNRMESELGREDIGTFAFRRVDR